MKLSLSVGPTNKEGFLKYTNAGFKHFELSMGNFPRERISEDKLNMMFDNMQEVKESLKVDFPSAHAPYSFNPCESEESFEVQVQHIECALRVCESLGIDRMVTHAGFGFSESYDEMIEKNVKYYNTILPLAERYNVTFLIENIAEEIYKRKLVIEYADNILLLREKLNNHPLIGACWDTGHANTKHIDQYPEIIKLKGILKGLHLQDNNGINDDHMPILMGTVNYDDVIQGLKDIGYDGAFNMETKIFNSGKAWPNFRMKYNEGSNAPHLLFDPDEALTAYGFEIMHFLGEYAMKKHGIIVE